MNYFCGNVEIADKTTKNIVANSITNISNDYNIPIQSFEVNLDETDYISILQIIFNNSVLLYENKKCINILEELSTDIIDNLRYDPFTTIISESIDIDDTTKSAILTIKIEYDN